MNVDLDESEDESKLKPKLTADQDDQEEDEQAEEDDEDDEDDEALGAFDKQTDDEKDAIYRSQPFGDAAEEDGKGDYTEDDESEEEEDGSDNELPSDLSGEEEGPDTLDGLNSFVEQLASADRKRKGAGNGDLEGEVSRKRRVLPVVPGPALGDGGDLGLRNSM